MPLPDATPDQRIYKLLKTTDLENLTFSDFQKVAQTIYAEQGAEDELRRIVLVNLARLSVAGEWTGLTSAGGGFTFPTPPPSGSQTIQSIHMDTVFQNQPSTMQNITYSSLRSRPVYLPFVANKSGDVDEIGVHVQATENKDLYVGIYESDSNGFPSTKLTEATINLNSSGDVFQTSLTGTATLTRGTVYYLGYVRASSSSFSAQLLECGTGVGIAYNQRTTLMDTEQEGTVLVAYDGTTYTLPADATGSSFGTVTVSGSGTMVLATGIVIS